MENAPPSSNRKPNLAETPPVWRAQRLSRLQAGAAAAAIIPDLKTDHSK
jgi:hypothetical protein